MEEPMPRSVAVLLLIAMASPAALAAESAQSKASPQGDSWSSIAKLPDWSGVWDIDWRSFNGSSATGETAPKLTPEYAARYAQFQAAQKRGEAQQTETANCVPPGMPGIMAQPYPIEFLFTPGKVTLAIEAYGQMRRIFTDGRPQPPDPDPTFQGHSIGRWEGDTLVVDTVAILPVTHIAPGIEHSDELRIEERIRRISDDTLQIRTTLRDPKVLLEPLTLVRNYKRHLDWDIKEYVCAQNNRDSADEQGRAGLDLER
jgi:hypothetical protein